MPRSYVPGDWYWIVGDGPADQVYESASASYVPAASDPDYLAFVADGNFATVIDTAANLRDELEKYDLRFQALPLRPIEEARPRVHRARIRLRRTGFSVASGAAGALIQWAAAGAVDPLAMWNAGNAAAITIPEGQDGIYFAQIAASFAASATGDRALQMRRNGAPIPGATLRQRAPASETAEIFGSRLVQLAGLDVFRVGAAQDSGGALLVDAEVGLLRIE